MVEMPAKCTACGYEFGDRSGFAVIGQVSNLSLRGNTTMCPKCGGQANIINGTFNVKSDKIEVVSADKEAVSLLARLNALKEKLERERDLTAGEAIKVANITGPRAKRSFIKLVKRKGLIKVVTISIALLTTIEHAKSATLNWNHLFDQVAIYCGISDHKIQALTDLSKAYQAGKEESHHEDADSRDDEEHTPEQNKLETQRPEESSSPPQGERRKRKHGGNSAHLSRIAKKGKHS